MPFGKYRGQPMEDVPASYLHWLWTQKDFSCSAEPKKKAVAEYIRANRAALEKEYPDAIWTTPSERQIEVAISDKRVENHKQRRCLTCRHFNGVQNGVCRDGVPYAKFGHLPCIPMDYVDKDQQPERCPKFSAYTPEEVEQQRRDVDEHVNRINVARKAIVDHIAETREESGAIECPVCKGRLRYSMARCNGHIHAQCSNPECVNWME